MAPVVAVVVQSLVRRPVNYPSLLRRYLASFIDVFVVLFLFFIYAKSPLAKTTSGAVATWPLWLFVVYEPICNRYATTLGQLAMGFRVRTFKDQRRVPLWRGLVRLLTKYGLGVISFIRMPVQKHRRALHDILSGTIALSTGSKSDAVPPVA
jgi:uncharacterized RDD family membrane protein YckC